MPKLIKVLIDSTFDLKIKKVVEELQSTEDEYPERTWAIVPATRTLRLTGNTYHGYCVCEIVVD